MSNSTELDKFKNEINACNPALRECLENIAEENDVSTNQKLEELSEAHGEKVVLNGCINTLDIAAQFENKEFIFYVFSHCHKCL